VHILSILQLKHVNWWFFCGNSHRNVYCCSLFSYFACKIEVRLYKKYNLLYRPHEAVCRRRSFNVVKSSIAKVVAVRATTGQVRGGIQ